MFTRSLKTAIMGALLLGAPLVQGKSLQTSGGELTNVRFSNCNQDQSKCLVVSGDRAYRSVIIDLYSLKNVDFKLVDGQNKVLKSGKGLKATYDFEVNQVVITSEPKKNELEELVFKLSDLSSRKYAVR